MKNEKWSGSPVLFILAGCYLLYLTWGLARDIMSGTVPDSRIIFIVIATIVFGICGAGLLFCGIRGYRMRSASDAEGDQEENRTDKQE